MVYVLAFLLAAVRREWCQSWRFYSTNDGDGGEMRCRNFEWCCLSGVVVALFVVVNDVQALRLLLLRGTKADKLVHQLCDHPSSD